MLTHTTNGNVPVMARIMRHKSWKSRMRYVHNIQFREEDYEETTATTVDEIRALGSLVPLIFPQIFPICLKIFKS